MNKKILSSLVALVFCVPTVASAQWENPGEDVKTYKVDTENDSTQTPWIKNTELEKNSAGELVYGGKANHITDGITQGLYSNSLLYVGSNNTTIANEGTLWVTGSGYGDAMSANNGGTVINRGTIFVEGNGADRNKAITVNPGGTGINEEGGRIVVGDGASGFLDGSGGTNKQMINNGTIEVVGDGIGINFRKEGGTDVKVENGGDILVTGDSGIGVKLVYDGNHDKVFSNTESGTISVSGSNAIGVSIIDSNAQFNNTGMVQATDEARAAIDVSGSNATINLSDSSNIEGLVDLNSTTTVNFSQNTDTIKLKDDAGKLNLSNSHITIELGSESNNLHIGSVQNDANSSLAFSLDRMGDSDNKILTVDNVNVDGSLDVSYTGEVSDALLDGANKEDLFKGIQLGDPAQGNNYDLDYVTVEEGLWGNGAIYYKDGTVQVTSANTLLSSTTDLALMNGLVWRSQLTNLSDRMGTLRTMPQAAGAWARYNNGRLDGRGIEYDYNTIEVGFDAPVSSNFLVGVSFDYTISDTDLNAGSADNDVYTLGLYGTYFGDNGGFVDLMAKIGRIDNEYDISNKSGVENGDYMMTGAIVGIEAGHRFDLAHNTFVEPQVQLSYSWLRASDYSTNVRSVDFETIESLVARVGVMGGIKFNENRGAAYLKASYNHDFLGDVDAEFTALDGSIKNPVKLSDELDDNWAEVSLGFSYNVTDSFNTFLDVGTGFGGDIDQKWRVNFGGRYTF